MKKVKDSEALPYHDALRYMWYLQYSFLYHDVPIATDLPCQVLMYYMWLFLDEHIELLICF